LDWDLTTDATPDQVLGMFPDAIPVGKAFGVVRLRRPDVEVATFREESGYQDHRRPKSVKFSGIEEDAWRRDFTVNALYWDPKDGKIFDPTGGLKDLRLRILRAIGDPGKRFQEDALRLFRAVRLVAQLGFTLDPTTAEKIQRYGKLLGKISGERLRDELRKCLLGPAPILALEEIRRLNLWERIFPEIPGERSVQILRRIEILHRTSQDFWSFELGLSSILIAIRSTEGVPTLLNRLKLSTFERKWILSLLEDLEKFPRIFQMREATLERWICEPYFEDLLRLERARALSEEGNLLPYEFARARWEARRSRSALEKNAKLLKGEDLIELGLSPGPRFSEILRTIEDLGIEQKLRSKEEALEYVLKHFVR
jgi:poly(A) polymerase